MNGILYNIIYYQSTNAQDYRERSKKGIYYQPTNVQYCRERSKKEIVLERLPASLFHWGSPSVDVSSSFPRFPYILSLSNNSYLKIQSKMNQPSTMNYLNPTL